MSVTVRGDEAQSEPGRGVKWSYSIWLWPSARQPVVRPSARQDVRLQADKTKAENICLGSAQLRLRPEESLIFLYWAQSSPAQEAGSVLVFRAELTFRAGYKECPDVVSRRISKDGRPGGERGPSGHGHRGCRSRSVNNYSRHLHQEDSLGTNSTGSTAAWGELRVLTRTISPLTRSNWSLESEENYFQITLHFTALNFTLYLVRSSSSWHC